MTTLSLPHLPPNTCVPSLCARVVEVEAAVTAEAAAAASTAEAAEAAAAAGISAEAARGTTVEEMAEESAGCCSGFRCLRRRRRSRHLVVSG